MDKLGFYLLMLTNLIVMGMNLYCIVKTEINAKRIQKKSPYNVTGVACEYSLLQRLMPINFLLAGFNAIYILNNYLGGLK